MAKRKQNGEMFINKAKWSKSSVEKVKYEVEIIELLEKISDDESKWEPIESPKFNLGGVEMSIRVHPKSEGGVIGVFLHSYSDQDQTCSATIKTPAGVEVNWERKIIEANQSCGSSRFLTHGEYEKWAKKNGDVLKLDVSVSLYTKEMVTTDVDGWTRTR